MTSPSASMFWMVRCGSASLGSERLVFLGRDLSRFLALSVPGVLMMVAACVAVVVAETAVVVAGVVAACFGI